MTMAPINEIHYRKVVDFLFAYMTRKYYLCMADEKDKDPMYPSPMGDLPLPLPP